MHNAVEPAAELVGGRARARVVIVLGAALGLYGADNTTVSATADNLERAFHVGNTEIGSLVSVVSLTTAAATLPVGILTDRTRRTRLLAISMALAAATLLVAGAANSYLWLLLSRIPLGVVIATIIPAVASLTGDYFPAPSRGRMWGLLLGGELVGTGAGFVVSGEFAALVGWRAAFWWLVPLCLAMGWAAYRLPEPARGGQSRLHPGQATIPDEREVAHSAADSSEDQHAEGAAHQVARRRRVDPRPDLVLHSDPTRRSLWWAIGYILRVRTNLVLIACSTLAYFFLAGVQSFGLLFLSDQYRLPKSTASILALVLGAGALTGVYLSGRLSDRLLGRNIITARVLCATVALLAAGAAFVPPLLTTSAALAIPVLTLAAGLLAAVNSPLDAARLDIMHAPLWGRAEAVRTVLRSLAQAAAPVAFGYLSESVFGGGTTGLQHAFLALLSVLVLAGLLALLALRTYPRDVATVGASTYGRNQGRESS